jgi:hypothetical protein
MNEAIQTFTANSFETIVNHGGDYAWVLNQNRAKNYKYLVCCSSVGANRGSGFLVGKINGVEFHHLGEKGKARYTLCISEVAVIDVPNLWPGHHNPVRYTSLEELGIDLSALKFRKVSATPSQSQSLTIAQAKAGLAQHYGVSQDSIEIIIKG